MHTGIDVKQRRLEPAKQTKEGLGSQSYETLIEDFFQRGTQQLKHSAWNKIRES